VGFDPNFGLHAYEWDEFGARFHHRLVAVHPFANGNGRHARLMTETLLKSHGQALFSWGSVT
jgi:fido (protein-threonine AMPylation protein)